jgi:hypothetical protein
MIGDPVAVEQVANVAALRDALAGLQPADLGNRALEFLGDVFDGEAGPLAQRTKLSAEPAPRNYRPTCWGHRTPPPASCPIEQDAQLPTGLEKRHATPLQ